MIPHFIKISDLTNNYFFDRYNLSSTQLNNFQYILELRYLTSSEFDNVKNDLNDYTFFINEKEYAFLIIGDKKEFHSLLTVFNNNKYSKAFQSYFEQTKIEYSFKNSLFNFSKSYVMGILNVTPDSFSDGGDYIDLDVASGYALSMIDEGADIIDIGGESTRPGAEAVSIEEEINRVVPVIKNILKENTNACISIDTTKSEVAKAALENGASIVNDISGLTFDPIIADVVSNYNAGLVLMHIKGTPQNMQNNPVYDDVMVDVIDFLTKQIEFAKSKGITKIIVDPGIGFGKRVIDNYEIIKRLSELNSLGFPILMGLSRKSFIGKSLNLETDLRDNATVAANTISLMNGARIIRTHNVQNAIECREIFNNTIDIKRVTDV